MVGSDVCYHAGISLNKSMRMTATGLQGMQGGAETAERRAAVQAPGSPWAGRIALFLVLAAPALFYLKARKAVRR